MLHMGITIMVHATGKIRLNLSTVARYTSRNASPGLLSNRWSLSLCNNNNNNNNNNNDNDNNNIYRWMNENENINLHTQTNTRVCVWYRSIRFGGWVMDEWLACQTQQWVAIRCLPGEIDKMASLCWDATPTPTPPRLLHCVARIMPYRYTHIHIHNYVHTYV